MMQHIAQPLGNIVPDALLLALFNDVEAGEDQRQGAGRDEKRAGVDKHERGQGHDKKQHARQQRPQDAGPKEAGLDTPVGSHQIVLIDQAGNGRELTGIEENLERGTDKGHTKDPPDVERAEQKHDRDGGDDQRLPDVDQNHHALAVQPVHPRADYQAKEQIGQEGRGSGDTQVQRRAGQLEDQQRQGELGE